VTGLDSSHRVDHGLASESDLPRLRARNGPFYSKKTVTNVGESIARRYSQAVSDIFAITAPLGRQRGPYRRRGLREHKSGGVVLAANSPPLGIEVEVDLVLPASGYVRRPVGLRCVGRVSRTEICFGFKGFAVAGRFLNESQGDVGF
jgi:hypothetical protein